MQAQGTVKKITERELFSRIIKNKLFFNYYLFYLIFLKRSKDFPMPKYRNVKFTFSRSILDATTMILSQVRKKCI